MPTEALILGLNNLIQNVVYALPARKVFILSGAAVEVSNLFASGFAALAGANTTGVETSAQFIRCTLSNTTVSLKV